MTHSGRLTVITGPSGVGKGSLVKKLLERNKEFWLSISATTRKPREGEMDGEHYFFLERDHFEKLVKENGFLEWAEFAGNLYGTPRSEVLSQLEQGKQVLLEIELEGARKVRQSFPEAFQLFIAPPSLEELERRIRGRETEEEKSINMRLRRAQDELKAKGEFDELIVNDDFEEALLILEKLVRNHEKPENSISD